MNGETQMPNKEMTDTRQAPDKRIGTSFRLNSTTALALSTPPRKVGAESSSSYTVTGKGTITSSSRMPLRTVHAATSSYFSRCSRSRAQRVLTSRLSGSQWKGRLSPEHQTDQQPQDDPELRGGELPSSGPHREQCARGDRAGVHAGPGPWPLFSFHSGAKPPSTVFSEDYALSITVPAACTGAEREEQGPGGLPQVLNPFT